MNQAELYQELKGRVAKMDATAQFLSGRREAHEANKAAILAKAAQMGLPAGSLEELRTALEKKVDGALKELSNKVAEAEDQFNNTRSSTDVAAKT